MKALGWLRQRPFVCLGLAMLVAGMMTAIALVSSPIGAMVGILPSLVGPILAWAALFRDDAKKLVAELAGRLLWWTRQGERLAVAAGLEADIDRASRRLDDQAPGLVSRSLRVQWHRGESSDPFLEDGRVVVKLRDHRQRDRNLIAAVIAQVSAGTLHHAKPHLDVDVCTAADFAIARDMLKLIDPRLADRYVEEVCVPQCRRSAKLAELVEQTRVLDEQGVFTRVALREFIGLGERLGGDLPSATAARDSVQFVKYLYRIATKAPTEDLDDRLGFVGKHLRVGVVLVARPQVYALHGVTAYTLRAGEYIKLGATAVYLAARSSNVEYARTVAAALRKHGNVSLIEEFEFESTVNGINRPAYIARVTVNQWLSRRADRRFEFLRELGRTAVS